jgi:exopolyphosphatase/pppGpp-phosphohydrolase
MNKRAVIDIGSLKVKVAVFDVPTKSVLESSSYLTLLGKGIDESGVIEMDSLQKLDNALDEVMKSLKREKIADITLIGTEALRKAKNIESIHGLIEKYLPGHMLEVIDQHKEAILFFKAVSREFPNQNIAAVDIGGGSVQLIYGKYDAENKKVFITKQHHLKTGTYTLQQKYSPENDKISHKFDTARNLVKGELARVKEQAPILIFGSTCMLDFIQSTGIATHKENQDSLHPVHVRQEALADLLEELRGIKPNNRDHYFPAGGYFMYGADYLLLNLLETIEKVHPQKVYPTNLNSSYGFL